MTATTFSPPATTAPADVAGVPALPAAAALPADRNPAAVYLASLAEGPGRASMRSTGAGARAARVGASGPRVHALHPRQRRRDVGRHHRRLPVAIAPVSARGRATHTARRALRPGHREQVPVRHPPGHARGLAARVDAGRGLPARAVPNVKGSRLPAGRALDGGELRALFAACQDGTAAGARDAAAFALMFGCGLRRAEAVAADLADYDPESGALTVVGKGNRQRRVYAPNGGRRAMDAWTAVRGDVAGPLLAPISKGGTVQAGPGLSPHALAAPATPREAGIAACTPHDLRRTFVSAALANGADLAMVQALAGHASPTTTARYDHRPEDAKRAAAQLVHVPFAGLT